ncbi:MAG TPA: hypothetical protein VKH81_04060 [Candidatus Angelobacter sp.]|nr:hypothetical protein [Candidatus Angelobacter sp.]
MTNAVTEAAIKEADQAFSRQVTNQVARLTGELNRLEQLLTAGMVDRRVLANFRYAVDRARQTGWQIEKWLDGDSRELSTLITEERVGCIARMCNHLASELEIEGTNVGGADALRTALLRLDTVLNRRT